MPGSVTTYMLDVMVEAMVTAMAVRAVLVMRVLIGDQPVAAVFHATPCDGCFTVREVMVRFAQGA
ncbi:hypothetical protein [Xanthomonas campestris]|uniref:hypothetical protein n=1 Tax=Xanthomonas campestris TaxID=339 RepID=UPI001E514065|nr:hypothetical protein [Xanthomonas campestris]MCC4606034.1 hypothetical protein [Xanthomonas campestris pv. parthenii]